MNLLLLLAGCLLLFCSACSDSSIEPAKGSMTGFVSVVDENGVQAYRNGVKVSLENTGFETFSDSSGRWKLDNVPAGIYTIAFSRDSLSTNKIVAYQFVGNGTAYVNPIQVPYTPKASAFIDSLRIDSSDKANPLLIVHGSLTEETPSNFNRSLLIFLGANNDVSSDPRTYSGTITTFVSGGSIHFTEAIPYIQLSAAGFTHNSRVYLTSYFLSRLYYRYNDITTGRQFFSGISPARKNFMTALIP